MPVMSTGLRFARAAYTAAVYPAGPEPRIRTLAWSVGIVKNPCDKQHGPCTVRAVVASINPAGERGRLRLSIAAIVRSHRSRARRRDEIGMCTPTLLASCRALP